MIRHTFTLSALISMAASTLLAAPVAEVSTVQTPISADNVFVALGFDSNDESEIFIGGTMPSTCYRRPLGEITSKGKGEIAISLTASKIQDPNVICMMVQVPYLVPVSLGNLPEGVNTIKINAGTPTARTSQITIETPGSTSVDNFTYANVTKVEKIAGSNAIVIEGYHPSSCMDFLTIEVRPNKTGDTYSILPIIQQSEHACDRVVVPFLKVVNLPKLEARKEALVYVRKIDGRALHYLFKNEPKLSFPAVKSKL